MLSRYKHTLLRRNHSVAIPSRCLFLDVETHHKDEGEIEKHRMYMGWTCAVRYKIDLTVTRESWQFWEKTFPMNKYIMSLADVDNHLYIFGHNIFFDLQSSDFFYYFTKWGWELDFYYESNLTYILVIKHKTEKTPEELKKVNGDVTKYSKYKWRRMTILSTTNYYDQSLEEVGKMLGYPKLKVDFDNVSDEDLKIYCKRDVEITRMAMEYYFKFIREHDLGKFSLTKSSQSFRAFRHRFMTHNIFFHDSDETKKLEREAYFGGRTECFSIGKIKRGPFLTLDVNSMYPHVMRFTPVPVQLVSYHEKGSLKNIDVILKKFAVVAECDLNTELPIYAYRYNKKLVFPIGKFRTFLCTPGLREARARKHLKRIHRMAIYRKEVIFQDFVDYFYPLKIEYKEQKNKIMETLTKYILNSLYGKFGQKRPVTRAWIDITYDGYYRQPTFILPEGVNGIEYKMFNRHVWLVSSEEAPKSFPAIAAHITEAARLLLWKIIEETGPQYVLYCDTDSIKIRKRDLHKVKWIMDEKRLGALKVESTDKRLTILGNKSYITENVRKLKGVPRKAKEIEELLFAYPQFQRQATHMEKQVTRYYIVKNTTKKVKIDYDKGIINEDKTISPFRL